LACALWFYSSPALWQVHTRQANSFLPLNQKTYGTTVKLFNEFPFDGKSHRR